LSSRRRDDAIVLEELSSVKGTVDDHRHADHGSPAAAVPTRKSIYEPIYEPDRHIPSRDLKRCTPTIRGAARC
jgi:hypothetical protein